MYSATLTGYHPKTQGMHMHTPTAQSTPHGGQQGWPKRHCARNHIGGLSATDRRVIETHIKPRGSTRQGRLPALCPPQTGSYRGLRGDAFGGRAIGRQHGWLGGHYNHILGLSAMDRRVIETNAKPKGSTRQRRLPPCAPRAGGQGVTNVEWRSAFGQQEWPGWHYSHILGL